MLSSLTFGLTKTWAQQDLDQPSKTNKGASSVFLDDFSVEWSRYQLLKKRVTDGDLRISDSMARQWDTIAKSAQTASDTSAKTGPTDFVLTSIATLSLFNTNMEQRNEDQNRILALECCHGIKKGKVCDSQLDEYKARVKTCQAFHNNE